MSLSQLVGADLDTRGEWCMAVEGGHGASDGHAGAWYLVVKSFVVVY
jgi:hypothetical protein